MTHVVPIGTFLAENNDSVPVEPETIYPLSGVTSYTRGLFVRGDLAGTDTTYKKFHRIHSQQIILSTLKGWEGAIALAGPDDDGRFLPPHNVLFDVDTSKADPAYCFWGLRRPSIWAALLDASRGMGARRETVKPADLYRLSLPLPPLAEQRRIVVRLDAAAEAVATRARAAKAVEAEVAATLRAAFAHITADAPRTEMADIAPLVRRPVTIDPKAAYPELGVRSFGRGLFAKPDIFGADLTWQSLYRIEAGDLVFSNIKAWEGAFAVAEAEHHDKYGSHRYLTCVPDPMRATAGYLWFYLQSEEGLHQVDQASAGSADRNRTLAVKRLEKITVPVPPIDAQRWFDQLQAKARAIRVAQGRASAHLDALLPAMLDEVFDEA